MTNGHLINKYFHWFFISQQEAQKSDTYFTALLVTIVVGCSLLVLNILIFIGVYYQLDRKSASQTGDQESMSSNESPKYVNTATTVFSNSASGSGLMTQEDLLKQPQTSMENVNRCKSRNKFDTDSSYNSSLTGSPGNVSVHSVSGNGCNRKHLTRNNCNIQQHQHHRHSIPENKVPKKFVFFLESFFI